jgi:transcriptional regulator with XRE-family HTH domain
MSTPKKLKDFFKSKGLTNRDVSKIMDGYSEEMISRYTIGNSTSLGFVEKVIQYFPELDFNYLLGNTKSYAERDVDNVHILAEPIENYVSSKINAKLETMQLLSEMKATLAKIESNLTQI